MEKLISTMFIAGALLAPGAALADSSTSKNHVSAGVHDQYNSSFYVGGAFGITNDIAIGFHHNNAFDGFTRAEVQFHGEDRNYLLAGVSNYSLYSQDKTGFYGGLAINARFNNEFAVVVGATYDTALSGFFSFSAKAQYQMATRFFVEAGYKINTNGMDDEALFGIGIRF